MQDTGTPEGLRDSVIAALSLMKSAQDACWQARKVAELACDAAQAPARALLHKLQHEFEERALELAVDADRCPCNHSGGDMRPTDIEVSAEGIELTWDINGNYAPYYYTATWEDLLAPVLDTTAEGECE
jgi:hypothetical protein